jgi:putative nucleotidyltransferase with HDIG domain
MIGQHYGLAGDELEDLRRGALLHDIGKIAVDPAIQNKQDKLSPEEYCHIMKHTETGADIVKPIGNEIITGIIQHHHCRYDGKGLNQIVTGKYIPLGARIVALADTFDAMKSDRPYRPAMTDFEALSEIIRCNGTQFDPEIVEIFFRINSSISVYNQDNIIPVQVT